MADTFRDGFVDLPDATITLPGGATFPLNRFAVRFHVVDSKTQQTTLASFRAGNGLVWPDVLATLTGPQRRRVLEKALEEIIAIKLEALG